MLKDIFRIPIWRVDYSKASTILVMPHLDFSVSGPRDINFSDFNKLDRHNIDWVSFIDFMGYKPRLDYRPFGLILANSPLTYSEVVPILVLSRSGRVHPRWLIRGIVSPHRNII